jgi:GTP cyclohydrolase II
MSSAFVRESDEQRLNEVSPTLSALMVYLRRENGGMTVREIKSYYSDKHKRDVYEMSDGLAYARDDDSKWYIILD